MKRAIVGIPVGRKNKTNIVREISQLFSAGGRIQELGVTSGGYKLGNLDTMMHNYDVIQKFDSAVEGILRKLEKSYVELNPKNQASKLRAQSKELGVVTIEEFIAKFTWDESRFPRNMPLEELIKLIVHKANQVDSTVRARSNAFNDAKNLAANLSKKDSGASITARDLGPLISFCNGENIERDFVSTPHLHPVVCIVPLDKLKAFLAEHEKAADYVVPGSRKELRTDQPIGNYKLFRVYLCHPLGSSVTEEFARALMNKGLNVAVRDVKVDRAFYTERQKKSAEANASMKNEEKNFQDTLEDNFKDAYNTYIHLKTLRAIIDSSMRFGASESFFMATIEVPAGREKKLLQDLTTQVGDPSTKGMYGTKEEIEDTEDFYPFSYVPISIP